MGDACSKCTQLGTSQFRHQPKGLVSWWLQSVHTCMKDFPFLQIICARQALATTGRTCPALTDPLDDTNPSRQALCAFKSFGACVSRESFSACAQLPLIRAHQKRFKGSKARPLRSATRSDTHIQHTLCGSEQQPSPQTVRLVYSGSARRCYPRTSTHDLGTTLKHSRGCTKTHLCRRPSYSWYLATMHARPLIYCVSFFYPAQQACLRLVTMSRLRQADSTKYSICSADLAAERNLAEGFQF
jgi:hypothetical protein